MADNRQKVKVTCGVDGYEHVWIEYDVTDWGLNTYIELHTEISIPQTITEFIPRHCSDWHITDGNGTAIAHPGYEADIDTWNTVWKQFDLSTGRILYNWLWLSTLRAIQEAMALPPKSAGNDQSGSAETKKAPRRGNSEPAS